jgi:uridine phosphorylase
VIKLRTKLDKHGGLVNDGPRTSVAGFNVNCQHDAAVAHALVKAMQERADRTHSGRISVKALETRAAEILKSDFGIEP